MAKVSSKDVIARVKRKQALDTKANVTFRLNKTLMDKFRDKCEKQGLSMAAVLEELIESFVV